MVIGIQKFKEYFKEFPNQYIIIGGTACDIIMEERNFVPRGTQDIDMILIVEALSVDFVKQFWLFIKEAGYELQQKSADERIFYRFLKPANKEFPKQIELFSRIPDSVNFEGEGNFTPIPIDDDLSNLSAILMDEDYYNYTLQHAVPQKDLRLANIEALVCLKAKAFINLTEQKEKGEQIDAKKIAKHKTDVFRLAAMLTPNTNFDLPPTILNDLQVFAEAIKNDLPNKQMFENFGLPNANAQEILNLLIASFGIEKKEQS